MIMNRINQHCYVYNYSTVLSLITNQHLNIININTLTGDPLVYMELTKTRLGGEIVFVFVFI